MPLYIVLGSLSHIEFVVYPLVERLGRNIGKIGFYLPKEPCLPYLFSLLFVALFVDCLAYCSLCVWLDVGMSFEEPCKPSYTVPRGENLTP